MLEGFQSAGRIPEVRRKILFTLAMLAVYRLGVAIPTPGIDRQALAAFFSSVENTIFGLVNMFSGGAFEQFSVFSSASSLVGLVNSVQFLIIRSPIFFLDHLE